MNVEMEKRFPIGCRVRLSKRGMYWTRANRSNYARIVGHGREGTPYVRIVFDGMTSPQRWHNLDWERVIPVRRRAADVVQDCD